MAASGITGSSQVIGLLHSASSFFKHPAARGRPEQAASEASRKRSQSNATPIRFSFRHTIWQVLLNRSLRTKSVKRSGIKSGVATSSAAPVSERSLTVQSIPPPPNSIVPAFKMRRRWASRCSSMMETFDGDAAIPSEAPLGVRLQAAAYTSLTSQANDGSILFSVRWIQRTPEYKNIIDSTF
jgi:hypothetical protein